MYLALVHNELYLSRNADIYYGLSVCDPVQTAKRVSKFQRKVSFKRSDMSAILTYVTPKHVGNLMFVTVASSVIMRSND
jgi:hypothetical protein